MPLTLPPSAEPLIDSFRCAFTRPTYQRFVMLCVGVIVTFGRRSVSRILWTLGPAAAAHDDGHPSSYHRLLSRARWSLWPLARALAAAVLELVPADQPVLLAVDDTVAQHRGKHVYGKGCHRDAVRSNHGANTVRKWGHKWVVVAVLVKLPFAQRRWALPVLCALYRVPKVDEEEARRHKTPCDLARSLLAALLHGFPDRRFIALGDGGFASHELAGFCSRHKDRLTLIARSRPDMNLYALPGEAPAPSRQTLWRHRTGRGRQSRRCRRGRKLPSPEKTVAAARRQAGMIRRPTSTLQWYGQSRRAVQLLSGCGGWYRGRGNGTGALVPVRWVCVYDPAGDRHDWFFCTDPRRINAGRIVELFACRWSIEATFQEARAHLGFESPRQRCRRSVLRTAPCLLGCLSVVSLIFTRLWKQQSKANDGRKERLLSHQTPCYCKTEPTFADALYAVRREMWERCLLKHVLGPRRVTKLPPRVKRTLLSYLAEAA